MPSESELELELETPHVGEIIHATSALVNSMIILFFITFASVPDDPEPEDYILSREAVSALHSTLISVAAAVELFRQRHYWHPNGLNVTSNAFCVSTEGRPSSSLMNAQSAMGKYLISWECGFLFADFVMLAIAAKFFNWRQGEARHALQRSVNWRVMGWHHLGIGLALLMYHIHGTKGPTKGVMIMVMMLLMNVSTPFGTYYWYLAKYYPEGKRRLAYTYAAYVGTYAIFRVYIMYLAHSLYAQSVGKSMADAYNGTPPLCMLGVATIVSTNSLWLASIIRKFFVKHLPVLIEKPEVPTQTPAQNS